MILPWQRHKNFEISLKCILRDPAAIKNLSSFTQSIKKKHVFFMFYQCTSFQPCSQYWLLAQLWKLKLEISNWGQRSSSYYVPKKSKATWKQRYLQLQIIMVKSVQPFKNGHLSAANVHLGKGTRFSCLALFLQNFRLVSYSLVLHHFQLMRI